MSRITEKLEDLRALFLGAREPEDRMGARAAKKYRDSRSMSVRTSSQPGRVPYVPTWRPGDLVVPASDHDKRVYRLAEDDHLVVMKQGPTFLLARNPRTDTTHHFTNRQAKRLVAPTRDSSTPKGHR